MKTTSQDSGANDRKAIWLLSITAAFISGLCCLTPVVLVLIGLASVSFAASLGNVLYGHYAWAFRGAALLFLTAGLVVYFRRRGICTLREAKRQKQRIINVTVLVLTIAISSYFLWTYVAVHYAGIAAGITEWSQYNELWAIPAAVAVAVIGGSIAFWLKRKDNKASPLDESQKH